MIQQTLDCIKKNLEYFKHIRDIEAIEAIKEIETTLLNENFLLK